MVNILAQHGIEQLDRVDSVKIFVGGLPQHPEPPLNYMLVYSLEGALDYYTTLSWVLRNGKRTQVEALSEREPVKFDQLGELEAFHTAGGLSTMAFRYEGQIPAMEYKTLRYPGHAQIMEDIRSLGLLDTEPVDVKGVKVAPRDVFIATVQPKLTKPKGRDLVALRVVVTGSNNGTKATKSFELVDRYDEKRGVSAMMRTTGYSLSITGLMQVRGQIKPPGVCTPDECVPPEIYIGELRKRGIDIKES
jgi:lysine 6-dehydrogenase